MAREVIVLRALMKRQRIYFYMDKRLHFYFYNYLWALYSYKYLYEINIPYTEIYPVRRR